jgi:hypothetical protein
MSMPTALKQLIAEINNGKCCVLYYVNPPGVSCIGYKLKGAVKPERFILFNVGVIWAPEIMGDGWRNIFLNNGAEVAAIDEYKGALEGRYANVEVITAIDKR